MKGGITLALVLFASITMGYALQCYECTGKGPNACNPDGSGGGSMKTVECTGWCSKIHLKKTG